MFPLDVKRMEKVFGPFLELESIKAGPDLIVTKDIDLANKNVHNNSRDDNQNNINNNVKSNDLDDKDFKENDIKDVKLNGNNISNNVNNNNNNNNNDDKDDNKDKSVTSVDELMNGFFGSNNRARPLPEMIKVMRSWMQEKRNVTAEDQTSLQESIDCIQKCIDIDSQQVMVDRLSAIARNFKYKSSFRSGLFSIDAGYFYVEVRLEPGNGRPVECNVQHYESSKSSCPALAEILRKKQFDEFASHLSRMALLYNISSEKSAKLKIFTAFDSLERDILLLESISKNTIIGRNNLVHQSPVGVVEPRQGGTPMKLFFFIRPDELFEDRDSRDRNDSRGDKKTGKTCPPFTIETVIKRQLGHHVRVEIEATEVPVKLQQLPLCGYKDESKKLPEFGLHNSSNSTILKACFVLKLSQPVILSQELAQSISSLTNQTLPDRYTDLVSIFADERSKVTPVYTEGGKYFVETKSHVQKYRINQYSETPIRGVMVDAIKFNHPAQISKILSFLRQQLLFNSFLDSVFKTPASLSSFLSSNSASFSSKLISNSNDSSSKPSKMVEMTFDDLRSIHVKFSNPLTQQEITLIVILDGKWSHSAVKCRVFPETLHETIAEDKVLKFLQKTSSIPETVSFVINRILEADRKARELETPTTPIVKSTNTMLLNMLQDTGHAGKKRVFESLAANSSANSAANNNNQTHNSTPMSNSTSSGNSTTNSSTTTATMNDSSTSTEGLGREKKRRRTESCDSKASNSSQESSSISLLLSKPTNTQNSSSGNTANLTLASVLSSTSNPSSLVSSLSSALSSSSSGTPSLSTALGGPSSFGDIVKKQIIKPKNMSLLQSNDSTMMKLQQSKSVYLKSTSRQNSQEASSPISSSGMPENYAESVLSQVTVFANKPVNKDGSGSVNKKLGEGSQVRRHTVNTVVDRIKSIGQSSVGGNNSSGSLLGSSLPKNSEDRNAFTIKQSNSSGIKLHITKNKSPPGSSQSSTGNGTVGSSTGSGSTGNSGSGNSQSAGESNAAAELFSKMQTSQGFCLFGNKSATLTKTLKNYSIPKIPKPQQQPTQSQRDSSAVVNALTDLDKKPIQFSQRSSTSQMGPRTNSPMRQNSQPSPQIQRSPQTPQNLFPKQAPGPRFPTGFNKPAKSINSIANSLFAKQNSTPPVEDSGLFKGLSSLSTATSQSATSSMGSSLSSSHSSDSGVHSSSQSTKSMSDLDVKPLSTPSSPVESPSGMLLEQSLQSTPVIIPVEAIETKADSLSMKMDTGNGDSISSSTDKN